MSDGYDDDGQATGMEIAIIGMAGRFPGARNIEEYWRNLVGGVESITTFTREELEAAGEDPALVAHPDYVPVARVVDDIDLFDAAFFGYSPREAEILDPQQRLYTECVYEALEHAGYDPDRFPGLVGVYGGSRIPAYLLNLYRNPGVIATVGDFHAQLSNDKDYVATRVAYKLNLGGASVTVQTACSTALVALHFACQSLLAGEADMAVAGAIALRVPQVQGYLFRDGDVGSPDGRVHSFDAKARGTIFGAGLGAVVLKRLEDAVAGGDQVYAVVKGSALNNDAAGKVGFTAPGADGQARVIRAAQIVAGVEPDSISYVEAHGTGTPMGDPIEVSALTRAFRERTERKGFCGIGSVKANIGHAGPAAGVAGLIKTALALDRKLIPPSILFERPNPQIDFAASPFYVVTEPTAWEANGSPRRAGVSAFGIGGTNAHVILEEAPARRPGSASRPWQLLVLSAKTPAALDAQTSRLAAHLADPSAAHPAEDLADVAYTLQVGRKEMEHRRTVVAAGREDAVRALADPARLLSGSPRGRSPRIVYLFSGQGSQHVGMGRGLYESEPTFRAEIDRAAELLGPHLGLDLREAIYPPDIPVLGDSGDAAQRLEQTALAQPALFAVEHALARLWMEWGVLPQAMMGHSIGEYVAACLAGVMTFPEALALVAARGRLMQGLPAGAMLAVPLPAAEVASLLRGLGGQLSLAATNAPARSVVSGPAEAIDALAERLAKDGVTGARRLHTSHAFHSPMMEPILAPFLAEVRKVDLKPPQLPYISNVTGTWITAAEATAPDYWVRHLRGTVRFAEGLAELFGEGDALLLEVGPGKALASLARQQPGKPASVAVLSSLRHPQDAVPDLPHILSTLGQLWANGAAVDWAGFHAGERRLRVALPTYPFERKRYWIDPLDGGSPSAFAMSGAMGGMSAGSSVPRKRKDVADWIYLPSWKPAPLALAPLAPLVPETTADGAPTERWLLFADGEGLADRLAERLRAGGAAVTLVEPGAGFAALSPGRYAVSPGERGDYELLCEALRDAGELPDAVAHLWQVSAGPGGPVPEAELDGALDRGFFSLLHLAQGLAKAGAAGRALRIAVVGNGLHRVLPGDLPVPEKAASLGPVKVIPQEQTTFVCRSVDIEWPLAPTAATAPTSEADLDELVDDLVEMLVAELASPAVGAPAPEPLVAYRGGERWALGYEAAPVASPAFEPRLRERGAYFITGGLGGLGLVFAEHLARQARARLALVGRSPLPPRAEWDAWLAGHPANDPTSERIAKVRELEALGAEVLVLAASVADRSQMQGAVAAARARFGPLHGVIHSAGIAGGGIIQLKTRDMAARVLAPKVQGTRILGDLLAEGGERLDFLILCSSTVAVLGGVGQIDYCGANNYLDAYAQARSDAAGLVVSIDWSAWQETGMAVNTAPPPSLREPREPRETRRAAETVRAPLHPLIDRRLHGGPDGAVYVTFFSADRHWMLDEHRILGVGAIPGTTWVELARAAFAQEHGEGPIEIKDLLFETPLMAQRDESKEVRITLTRDGDGFAFRIASAVPGSADRQPGWQEHARGHIAAVKGAAAGAEIRHDLAALRAAHDRELELDTSGLTPQKAVFWGPRWRTLRRAQAGGGGALIELELPAEFHGDLERMAIHPALLDVATATGSALGDETFLPLAYRRILFRRPLPAKVIGHLRRTEGGTSRELLHFDVTLLDDEGRELMAIEGFTMKRLGDASRLQMAAPTAPKPEKPKGLGLLAAGGMLSAEGVEALRRVLSLRRAPQVVVSPRDLHALLAQARAVDRSRMIERAGEARAPQTSHPRPDLPTRYVAPRSAVEERLAAVWQAALGIQQVGIHDNFFDLGGDSVLGIQMISRATEAGLQLSPEQLFEHQTIAELAACLPEGSAGSDTGAAALAPGSEDADAGLGELQGASLSPGELDRASLSADELDKVFASLDRLPS